MRKQTTRREETKAVKAALAAAGIPAVVGHGRGTASGWIDVNIGDGAQYGPHEDGCQQWTGREHADCLRCVAQAKAYKLARHIVGEVTGRNRHDADIQSDYFGTDNVSILTQAGWCKRCNEHFAVHEGCSHGKQSIAA